MWKWTSKDKLKAIIIDEDSLTRESLEVFNSNEIENLRFIYISNMNNESSNNGTVKYYSVEDLLNRIFNMFSIDSSQMVVVSSNHTLLKDFMSYHISTIFVGKMVKEQLKFIPDNICNKLDINVLKGNKGYLAEVITSNHETMDKHILKGKREIILSDGTIKEMRIYFGGRYYPPSRKYILDDPLSTVIWKFKEKYNKHVDLIYDMILKEIITQYPIDVITFVPLKPNDRINNRFDRFMSLELKQTKDCSFTLKEILECKNDFVQKGESVTRRRENVKGAYALKEDVKGKRVVVLDDVCTSSATIEEIGKVLYDNGAEEVFAVILAANQMTESTVFDFEKLTCPKCQKDMSLRISRDGNLFFGCDTFSTCRITYGLSKGIEKIKEINKITVDNVVDWEDIY